MTSHYIFKVLTVIYFTTIAFAPPQYMFKWFPEKDTRWIARLAGISGLIFEFLGVYLVRHADNMSRLQDGLLHMVRYNFAGIAIGMTIAMLINHYVKRGKKS
jgi:hypothetical protein